MLKNIRLLTTILLLCFAAVSGQKKSLQAISVTENIIIDGKLDENIWTIAPIGSGFLMFAPDNGKPVEDNRRSEVQVAYDNNAIYIAARLYDNEPQKILREISQRDVFGTAEHFGVFINGYNDGQQDFRFFVSAAGVQMDCLFTEQNGEDFSWDAIWESAVKITDGGWIAEMRIPYAGLRFPPDAVQTWGINFYREFRRDRQQFTWSFIDAKIGNESTQSGYLEGIQNIKPPTRLFLIPYSSLYNEHHDGIDDTKFKAGLDVKYGISDSFTLDAILVPDFGQTRFDNVVLNLGPFEQQFNENRPFFTEGTDLFNKGNLVYTRRIGGTPSTYPLTATDEIVTSYPSSINLINALKLTGRTKKGLGIGILNALTEKTYSYVTNTVTGDVRKIEVEPLANYNVLVLDQRFNQNSSISLLNTNVTRNNSFRDANVSAILFDLNTKKNTYNASGNFKYSYINEVPGNFDRHGFKSGLSLGETSGRFRYNMAANYTSKDFDNNDLGINFLTDYHSVELNSSYRILNPIKSFNTFQFFAEAYSEFNNTTGRIQQGVLSLYVNSTSKKNNYWGYGVNIRPLKTFDFYEPRSTGRFVEIPDNYRTYVYYSPNYNKKLAVDILPSFTSTSDKGRYVWDVSVSPRYRVSNSVLIDYDFTYTHQNHNIGYIDNDPDFGGIIFTKRNRDTYINTLETKVAINNRMTVTLLARYYWSYAENRAFMQLNDDGTLSPSGYNQDRNTNFNSWNVDVSYSWWFAPGSQVSLLYRNTAETYFGDLSSVNKSFGRNIDNLFKDDLTNIFSVSIRYFIDYNRAKSWF